MKYLAVVVALFLGAMLNDVMGRTSNQVPNGVAFSQLKETSVLLTWTGEADSYVVEYDLASASGFSHSVVAPEEHLLIGGLEMATTYKVRVKAANGDGSYSDYSPEIEFTTHALAAEHIVGWGTDTGVNYLPMNQKFKYSYSQEIYLASEMEGPKTITHVAFQYFYGTSYDRTITLYMGHTSKSSFSNNKDYVPASELTEVFSNKSVNFNNSGDAYWLDLELDLPFAYNGTDNLVLVVDDNTNSYNNDDYKFYTHIMSDNVSICNYYNYANIVPTNPSIGSNNKYTTYRANTRFSYAAGGDCVASNLYVYNVGTTTAQVDWVSGNAEACVVEYKAVNDWVYTSLSGNGTALLENLLPDTEYEVRVKSLCAEDEESEWFSISFTTKQVLLFDADANPFSLGARPSGCWMEPRVLGLTNQGAMVTVNSISLDNAYFVLDHVYDGDDNPQTFPFTLLMDESINVALSSGTGTGSITGNMVVVDGQGASVSVQLQAEGYTPVVPDVWEQPTVVNSFPFSQSFNPNSGLHLNYIVPGGPASFDDDAYDAVFKLDLDHDVILTAEVTGDEGLFNLYSQGFDGLGGPSLDNVCWVAVSPIVNFEDGSFGSFAWNNSGTHPWTIVDKDGGKCMKSGAWNVHSAESSISLTLTTLEGTMSFRYLVSSEATCDKGYFYIDGVRQSQFPQSGTSNTWTTFESAVLPAGEHTFQWTYSKDGSVSSGEDSFFVDDIVFPIAGVTGAAEGIRLAAGVYYLVATSPTPSFTVNLDAENWPLPVAASAPNPADGTAILDGAGERIFSWTFGDFTKEYQLLLGTTNPPTNVVLDWTSSLNNSYVANLAANTQYYWQVNERNTTGVTNGDVWQYTPREISPDANGIIYVTETGAGTKDGSSWDNAADDLNLVLVATSAMEQKPQVWVAGGTYVGDGTASNNAFTMVAGVNVYGGFAGNESHDYDLSQRDFTAHPSILDGQQVQRVLYQPTVFTEATATEWDGFVIQNGRLTVADQGNSSYASGAGVYLRRFGTLKNCVIRDNAVSININVQGGGVYMNYGTLEDCEVYGNSAETGSSKYGGGVYAANGATLRGCTIRDNAAYHGGGAYLYGQSSNYVNMVNCRIENNTVSSDGGGVYARYAKIYNTLVANNLVSGNNARGGGVYSNSYYGPVYLLHCTVVNNKVAGSGSSYAGVYVYCNSSISSYIYNSVLWGNKAGTSPSNYNSGSYTQVVQYSAIEGGYDGTGNISLSGNNEGLGLCPMFTNPTEGAGTEYSGGDWTLREGSVLVNGGTENLPSELSMPGYDIAGNIRVQEGRPDIGAYESGHSSIEISPDANGIIYVTETGAGTKDGSSWDNAADDLNLVLVAASAMEQKPQVWVAGGAYVGDGTASNNAFTMVAGVNVYGGFAGNESHDYDLSQRDFTAHPSILDGQQVQRVLYQPTVFTEATATEWDGFVIQNGRLTVADQGNSSYASGAGVYLRRFGTLKNCVIRDNAVSININVQGGGVYMNYGTLEDCEVYGNSAETGSSKYGGGVYAANGATLRGCTIRDNAAYYGGGAYLYGQSSNYVNMVNCRIENNRAYQGAGLNGHYYYNVVGCNIANNTATYRYAGALASGTCHFVNTNIVNNLSTGNSGTGAGINVDNRYGKLTNCIIWGNKKNQTDDQYSFHSSAAITYCAIQGGYDGTGNITLAAENEGSELHPYFSNPTEGAGADYRDGDWSLTMASVLINQGTTAGLDLPEKDLAGNDRVQYGAIDLGAFESPYNAVVLTPDDNHILYVSVEGSGSMDGSSWANATPYLQLAANRAGTFATKADVWVKQGTYVGNGVSGGNAFTMPQGVNVYGGFVGDEAYDYDLSQRDFVAHASVLDGQGLQRVLYQRNDFSAENAALWDGFTLTNGVGQGAGAYLQANGQIHNCRVYGNGSTNEYGGGVRLYGSSSQGRALMSNCFVYDNVASSGAGVYSNYGTITNCFVYDNVAQSYGGGLFVSDNTSVCYATIVNNQCGNSANGAGLYVSSSTNTMMRNSIVWGNRKGEARNVIYNPGYIDMQYSALEAGAIGLGNLKLSADNTGDLMSPGFVDPENGDFTLREGSILINKGVALEGVVTDLLGNAREQQGVPDLGAFESHYAAGFDIVADEHNIIYVSLDGTGNGSSWAQACGDLQFALNRAGAMNPLPQVWVKAGTYYSLLLTSSNSAFSMVDGVNVYGGFAGNEAYDYDLDQRDFVSHATILDGRNAQRVLYQKYDFTENSQATWDGFTFRNGYVNGSGAGVYMQAYSHLKNCIVSDNVTTGSNSYGGGVYSKGLSAANNTITNCEIRNNQGSSNAGGVYMSYTTLTNCIVDGNSNRNYSGGGVYADHSTIYNCLVSNNHSGSNGGGIFSYYSNVYNTTIVNNVCDNTGYRGGGIHYYGASSYKLTNLIVWGNKVGESFDQYYDNGGGMKFSYSAIQGSQPSGTANINIAEANDGEENLNYVRFLAPEHDIYQLMANSSVVGMGDNNVGGLPDKDLAGRDRILDGAIEMGAYEQYCTNYAVLDLNVEMGSSINFHGILITEPGTYTYQWTPEGSDCDSLEIAHVTMSSSVWFVTENGAGTKDGSSWDNASDNLNTLLNNIAQQSGYGRKQVWVAGGTYHGYSSGSADFYYVGGVEVHGGFAGTETLFSQREPETHPTILSGSSNRVILAKSSSYPCNEDARALWEGISFEGGKQVTVDAYMTLENCTSSMPVVANGHLLHCDFTGFNGSNNSILLRLNEGAVLDACQVHHNSNNYALVRAEKATVRYCLFFNNSCTRGYSGGGEGKSYGTVINAIDDVLIDHCDFVNNRSEYTSSLNAERYLNMENNDVEHLRQSMHTLISLRNSTLQNSIVWGNEQAIFSHDFIAKDLASEVNYCAIEAGMYNGVGNIVLDSENDVREAGVAFVPSFLMPTPGAGHLISIDEVDWSLSANSICLKQGSDGSDLGAIASEAESNINVVATDGIIYVSPDGEGDGSSWDNATSQLQYAVAHANTTTPAAQVWVKEGSYTGNGNANSHAFNVVAGVEVYGGFAGDETSLEARDVEAHPSCLDGMNVQGVLYQNEPFAEDEAAVWDGFVVRNGFMDEGNFYNLNGAILLHPTGSSLQYGLNHLHGAGAAILANTTLRKVSFEHNRIARNPGHNSGISDAMKGTVLSVYGGSLDQVSIAHDTAEYVSTVNSMVNSYLYAVNTTMEDCDFNHNIGKIALYGSTVNGSSFTNNQVRVELPEQDHLSEAQLYADLCVMTNCRMADNKAVALNKRNSGSQYANTFHNCVIDHNHALAVVGHNLSNNDRFINCNINNNKSDNRSSSAYPISGGVFHNTVVWGNRNYSDLMAHFEAANLAANCSFNNCAVEHGLEGCEDEVIALATENVGDSETYEHPGFLAPLGGDYTLTNLSALIEAGDNSVVTTAYDFLGNERIMDDAVEIGAYEYRCVLYREYNDATTANVYPFYGEWLTESGQYVHRWPIDESCDSVVVLNLSFKRIIYVTETGAGLRNGSSWENAFGSLKDATEYAGNHSSDLNQIWVAEGLYRGDGTSVNAFRLFKNTQLYGGLTGTELSDYDLGQRDITNHETILDGDYIQRVIYQVEDATAENPLIIDGFTIKNGFSRANVNEGTALYLGRHVTIRNCKITENYTNTGVSAIYMYNDDFASCDRRVIYNNFIDCELTNNQGGYVVLSDHCAFTNCKISRNQGIGVYVVTYTRFDDCELVSNGGRAIRLKPKAHFFIDPFTLDKKWSLSYLDMTNCKVTNNKGAIYYEHYDCQDFHGDGRFMSCLFANNSATTTEDTRGGAFFNGVADVFITSSTFINNTAKDDGGALYGRGYKVANTIFSGNKASNKANQFSNHYYQVVSCEDLHEYVMFSIETYDVTYSAIEGGYPGEGNISLNNDDLRVGLDGSYRPGATSPCVNNGTTSGVDVPDFDLAGNSRVQDGRIDIGAYESAHTGRTLIQPDENNIIYVSPTPCGTNDGSSWENATSHFQMALNFALCHDPKPQLWVKKGSYGNDNAQFWSNLAMMPGVNVYGGLNGDEAANFDLSQRDLVNNLSILTGNSAKRVLEQFDDFSGDDIVTWDGFHIKSGYARDGYVRNIKYMSESAVDSYCRDYMNGGGVLLHNGGNLAHCEIYDNVAIKGGGVYREYFGYVTNVPTYITNSKFRHNYAIEEAGAIYMQRQYNSSGSNPPVDVIANCEISGNHSDRLGAMHTVRASVIGTSIIKNTTDLYAFDTINSDHRFNHYVNCVLWGNDSRNYAFQTEGRDNTYDYCAIQGGAPAENTGSNIIKLELDNTGDDETLHYPFFLDDENEIYRPSQNSAFVNLGDNENVVGEQDLAFKPRVKDEVVDMGAYEETCLQYEHKYVIANRQYNFYGRILTESGRYEHQWTPAGSDCDSLVSLELEIRCIWYVKEGGAGLMNGSSWDNATGDLNWAISQASACDTIGTKQVWVAQGLYKGNGTSAQAFSIKPNIEVLGGFEGNEEEDIDFDQRDFVNHASILDGSHCQRVLGNYGNESSFSPIKRATIDGFTIQNGYTTQDGGGVYAKNYITLNNLVVKNNQGGNGAGIYVDNRCEVSDCDIFSNTALHDGGGAWVKSSTLTYCEIYRNLCDNVASGSKRGGGIFGTNATINNCLIANNSVLTTGAKGGGMYIANSGVASQLLNCTMVNNYSYDLAGGVYSENSSSNNEFINCVLWGNKTDLNTQQIAVSASNVPIFLRYCAVQGGAAGIGNIKLTTGNNTNTLFSPKFVNPSENVGANYGGGDWRFQEGSILANHGERLSYTITKDLDDATRVKNNRIDIGAYESDYTHDYAVRPDEHNIIYVDAHNNSGDYSGDSWANAIPDLQLAINFAGDNDDRPKIWIAGGTYTGNGWPYVDAFVALNGIDLYGGFAGGEDFDYDLDERDLAAHATILDGQNIQRTLQQAHSTYFKYKQIEELHSATYDGLTLKNGFVYRNDGAVLLMQKGHVNRCIIENGEAIGGYAGGLYFNGYAANLNVDNTIIRNCKTDKSGGGYYVGYGHLFFRNCLFANNSAEGSGGAGTAYSSSSEGTHYNSTIVNNYAASNGGGLYIYKKIYNSVLWGNKVGNNLPGQLPNSYPGNDVHAFGNGDVLYSAIEGGFAGKGNITLNVNNEGNSDINYPMFVSPSIAAGAGSGFVQESDDWSLQDGSVLVNHGKLDYVQGSYDLGHESRIQNERVDLGAYESPYDFDFEIVPDANNIIYVTQHGAGLKNGSSWTNATPYLQFAMERATLMTPRPQIWMAAGVYVGSGVPEYPAFILPDGISLYGGFVGNEPASYDLSLRDFDMNITCLDGQNLQQIMRRDYVTSNNRDILNGITFQNGRTTRHGGAAYLLSCDIDYCKFLNNTVVSSINPYYYPNGGALYASSCNIYHSTFMNNYSNNEGGAIYSSDAVINWCLIKNNTAVALGGGVGGSPEIYNTEISYNQAHKGGGISGRPKMWNCTVVKNIADISTGPHPSEYGGGISLTSQLKANDSWSNNIIWGNRTGALVSNVRGSFLSGAVTYTALENDETFPSGTGNIVLQSDNEGTNPNLYYVRFADPDLGDFSLQESSMCINVGNNATAAPGELDLAGNERIQDGIVDMGAYEMTPVNCHVPTGLHVPDEEITFTTANVYWTPADNETQWLVYYRQIDDITPSTLVVDTNFVMLQDMLPNSDYFVKVRSICSDNEMSGFTLPVSFRTDCDPNSIEWTNYLDEIGLLPSRGQALQSNETVLFNWDYIEGAEYYDLYLWRTDHGNGLPIPDFPVKYGIRTNYTTVSLDRSEYQGYGTYDHCFSLCDNPPPLYLHQYDTTGVAYYAWYVVAHQQCAEICSDTMTFTTALPDLHVTALDCSYAQTGQVMTVQWTVKNDGIGPTPTGETWNDYIVLSYPHNWTQQSFTQENPESFVIATVPNLTALDPGESYTNSTNVFVPDDMYGTVFLFVLSNWTPYSGMHLNYSSYGGVFPDPYQPPYVPIDPGDPVGYMTGTCAAESFHEIEECDNFFYKRIEVDIPPYPDLIATNVRPPYEGMAGDTIVVSWMIVNQGGAGFENRPVTDIIYMTTDTVYSTLAQQVATYMDTIPFMAVGDTITRSMKIVTDERAIDTFNFFVRVDATNTVYESLFEGNNMSPVSVHPLILLPAPPPDLIVENLSLGMDTVSPYELFPINYRVKNAGYANAKPMGDPNYGGGISDSCGIVPPWRGRQWVDGIYLSDRPELNTSYATSVHNLSNDTILYTLTDLPTIDSMIIRYAECHFAVPDTLSANASHLDSLNYQKALESVPDKIASFYDRQHYYYRNGAQHNRYLNSYHVTGSIRTPHNTQEGKYYFFVWTDKNDAIFEYEGEDNNIAIDSIYVVQPDLTVEWFRINDTRDSLYYRLRNIGTGKMIDERINLTVHFNNAQVGRQTINFSPSEIIYPGQPYVGKIAIDIPCNFYEVNSVKLQATPLNDKDFTNNNLLDENYLLKNPDFMAHDLLAPVELNSGASFDVVYDITNKGSIGYTGDISLGVYLGLSPELNFITAEELDVIEYPIAIAADSTVTVQQRVTLPIEAQGPYYLYIVVNDGDAICEGDNVFTNYIVSDLLSVTLSPYPDLLVTEATLPGSGTAGMQMEIAYTATNQGIRGIRSDETWTDAIYVSNHPQFSLQNAQCLSVVSRSGPLAVGETYSEIRDVFLPNNLATDNYYIYIVNDVGDDLFEYVGEYNNVYQSASFPVQEYSLDLAVTSLSGPSEVAWADTVTYQYTVKNFGTRSTVADFFDAIYLSTDATWDDGDRRLNSRRIRDGVNGNGQYSSELSVVIPYGCLGQYYILLVTDYTSANPDSNPENNVKALAIDIASIPVPDLEVSDLELLTEYPACGQPIEVRYKVTNVGDGPTYGSYSDRVVLSRNSYNNGRTIATITRDTVIEPGEYYYDTATFIAPVPETGNYAFYMNANHNESLYEMNRDNNLGMLPIVIDMNAPGDLVVNNISFPSQITAGNSMTITWNVKNLGPNTLTGVGCSDVVYLSADTIFDADDRLLGNIFYDLNLMENVSEQHQLEANISGVQEGEYYIIVYTDARNTFYEVNEDNNRTVSLSSVRVELPILEFNQPQSFTMDNFQYKDYKLVVGDNISETVRVYVTSTDSLVGAVNNIYVLHDGVGTNLNYDFSTDGQMTSNSELYIPRTEAGYYGVSVFGYSPAHPTQQMTIEADILPFEIRSISPNRGGNTGKVTVKLIGSKFRHDMEVILFKDTDTIQAESLQYVNFNEVFVTFDLKGAELGTYSVRAINYCAGATYLHNGFVVVEGEPENLSTNLIIPVGLRANRYCCLTLEFGNIGNTDIVNPRIVLRSLGESWIGLRRGELNIHRTELEIPTQFDDEPDGILRPGVRHTITIYCYTNAEMLFSIDINDEIDAHEYVKNLMLH